MMDYHRCIGCRYCMAGCPFGARSFNYRDPRPYFKQDLNATFPTRERGVVEKCNFCEERLAVGLLPACVEACKVGALTFGDQSDPKSPVRKLLSSNFTVRRKAELGTQPNVYYII
jgi:Fe-S-cluster-containing dehydrogenase component